MNVDQLVNKPLRHPFQCLASVTKADQAGGEGDVYLLAACGPKLLSVNPRQGKIVSAWPADEADCEPATKHVQANVTSEGDPNDGERPAKKLKRGATPPSSGSIIQLTVSANQQHAVAVTDDKVIRVFNVNAHGALQELSQRTMPKRPCAIQVLPDNATIICGDKFGDVYSLPLIPSEPQDTADNSAGTQNEQQQPPPVEAKSTFKPTASNATVHTKRNRKALEAQQNQKNFSARKEPLKFEHKLLLGHVSMLTDVVFATHNVEGKERGFILTADRDEHVRISRGPPQSHVIEGFCLGHEDYVSKLCIIPGTDMLVSGGGDEELFIWRWSECKLLRKYDLAAALHRAVNRGAQNNGQSAVESAEAAKETVSRPTKQIDLHRVNVSGLWTVPFTKEGGSKENVLLVACEHVPALFAIPVNRLQLKQKTEMTIYSLENPPLAVTTVGNHVLVSTDARTNGDVPIVRAYQLRHPEGEIKSAVDFALDEEMTKRVQCLEASSTEVGSSADDKTLDDLLYGVRNLRKRDAPIVPHGDGDGEDQAMGNGGSEGQPKDEEEA
ncbi:hypothetical protein KC315_g6728 [Hortaea werneckii]|nr:hypothetical protein KC315_g6728 [Hortaea werneckii]